jgi:hypothetical protein
MNFDGSQSIIDSLVRNALNYHLIPPLILSSIIETSAIFEFGSGYGRATFGFLLDPLISLLPVTDPKGLMVSKILSAEAQSFIFSYDEQDYNAYTTFLYAAAYDFGLTGPILYGAFFGACMGYGYGRRDGVGFIIYCIFAYFVFFNAFTFFITGDWFWALIFTAVCFKPARSLSSDLSIGKGEKHRALASHPGGTTTGT